MKLCDLTQFYSPVSGGVKRYVSEKVRFLQQETTDDEHILIIPGDRDHCEKSERSRTYTIASPLISRTSRYRALLRLEAIEEILEHERPSLIESGDPYQVAWKAVHSGRALHIPVVGFYHSHFPEAYLRSARKFLGKALTEFVLDGSRRYIRCLYNSFARTLVPSPALGELLATWGVGNVIPTDLGVDITHFHTSPHPCDEVRTELGLAPEAKLLLYVGRLAFEKNTQTLFAAFRLLVERVPTAHLLIVGDGLQRPELEQLRGEFPNRITWVPYCADPSILAGYYRTAELFVHPGVQETFGLVTLEAQACGTPVVGIRGSYMDRIIHAGHDVWAAENTPAALAEAIRHALERPLEVSPEELSRRIITKYSWPQVFHRLFDLYRQVIAEYRPI